MFKKLSLFTVLFMLLLFTCNFSAEEVSEKLEDGVLTVGTNCEYAPYVFGTSEATKTDSSVPIKGTANYCDGYDMIIAQDIADQLGVDLELINMSFDGLVPAVNSDQIDVIIAGMTPTDERKEKITFSDPYQEIDVEMSIVVRKDSPYANAKDLSDWKGAKLSSQLGTFHGSLLEQIPNIEEEMPMDGFDGLIQATTTGVIDGFINETPSAIEQTKNSDDLVQVPLPKGEDGIILDEQYTAVAIGMKKGDDLLLEEINGALENISPAEREMDMEIAIENADSISTLFSGGFLNRTWTLFVINWQQFALGIVVTLMLAILGTIFGGILGSLLLVMRIQTIHYKDSKVMKVFKITVSTIAKVYIAIIRGTPMMVQAMLFFYGLVANILEPNTAGVIIISFNTAAYMAEILRSGVNGIDSGQKEAGRALGLSENQSFVLIILPQVFRNTLPAIANQLIVNVKDSSVLSVITVTELYFSAKQVASSAYTYIEAYFIIAVIYLILTILLTQILYIIVKKVLNNDENIEFLLEEV